MKRGQIAGLILLGVVLFAGAGEPAFAGKPTTSSAASPVAKRAAHAIPASVRIAGVRVGGLAPAAAAAAVRGAFARTLQVTIDGKTVQLHPAKLARAYLQGAIGHARSAAAGTNVHLTVAVRGTAVRAAVAQLARRFDRRAKSASLSLKKGLPHLTSEIDGRRLDQTALVARVVRALNANVRLPLHVKTRMLKPTATASSLGPVVLINRETNRLLLFHGNELWRMFPIATGQAIYPTPAGRFDIVVKWVNPWWYPPTSSAWAQGLQPVPPGPNNPLGTRWMGLSAPGIGIHGTDAPSSIGYSASHGCIRMQVADSEWLFTHVEIGTTVFIV
jgi:lipoprotein-anchoring transpeptidase ErfK/SrfK